MVGISEIKSRAEAINLSLKSVAKRAGVDPGTVYRAAAGNGDTLGGTLRKLTAALETEERRLAQHLVALPHIAEAAE